MKNNEENTQIKKFAGALLAEILLMLHWFVMTNKGVHKTVQSSNKREMEDATLNTETCGGSTGSVTPVAE